MSINLRTLLSNTVTAIKNKLNIDSFTWGEFDSKLEEAVNGDNEQYIALFSDEDLDTLRLPEGITKLYNLGYGNSLHCINTVIFPKTLQSFSTSYSFSRVSVSVIDATACTKVIPVSSYDDFKVKPKLIVSNAMLDEWKASYWKNVASEIVGV